MKAAVIGGGLAGCAAALELVDAGHDVTLFEARPTLGGAVQTLPEREGDPAPPPDNGQHIALGCFTEYLAFLERIGESGSVRRMRLACRSSTRSAGGRRFRPPRFSSRATATCRCATARSRGSCWHCVAPAQTSTTTRRSRTSSSARVSRPGRSSGSGTSSSVPRSTFRAQRRAPRWASSPCRPHCFRACARASSCCRRSRSAGCTATRRCRTLERRGAQVETGVRVDDVDDVAADAIVVATPPAESARLLGEPEPKLEPSPIVSVHLLFDRPLLRTPLAALLDSDAHWLFDRSALTGVGPSKKAPVRDSGPGEGVRGNREVPRGRPMRNT